MRGNYRRLLEAMAAGRFVPVGRGRNLKYLVYQDDAAAAIVMAAEHPGIAGRVYNVTDGECHSVTEILEALARALPDDVRRVSSCRYLLRACWPLSLKPGRVSPAAPRR